jgi:hypothetical protein
MNDRFKDIVIFIPGTSVLVGIGADAIRAEVLQSCISAHGLQYQCVWWDGRTRRVEWMEDFEVQPIDEVSEKTRIGFAGHTPWQGAAPQRGAPLQTVTRG